MVTTKPGQRARYCRRPDGDYENDFQRNGRNNGSLDECGGSLGRTFSVPWSSKQTCDSAHPQASKKKLFFLANVLRF